MTDIELTAKQRAFVNAYMTNGFNATQAAITAGYSEATAYSQGSRLLRNVETKAEIQRLMTEFIMPAEEVLSRLTEHARGDLGDIYDETTGRLNWDKARAEGKTALIKKIKHTTRRTTTVSSNGTETDIEVFEDEIELHSVQTALQLIGKYHGQFSEKVEHSGSVDMNIKAYKDFTPDDWDNPADDP
jgi:phage terminase small subunit